MGLVVIVDFLVTQGLVLRVPVRRGIQGIVVSLVIRVSADCLDTLDFAAYQGIADSAVYLVIQDTVAYLAIRVSAVLVGTQDSVVYPVTADSVD